MSAAWSKVREIDRLADTRADIDFEIPVTEFTRLHPQLASDVGVVSGRIQFSRESGFAVAEIAAHGSIVMVCQRCMQPMPWRIDTMARVALVTTEADSDRVPEHLEPMHAPGERISIRDLVEEELLLTLPIVPLHADASECDPGASAAQAVVEASPDAPTTQKPFERLGELFKRDS